MKKTLIVFLCLLVTGLVWCFWPEYGSGYSEEQRRLWNERRAVYPVEWVVGGMDPRGDARFPYSEIAWMTGRSVSNAASEVGPLVEEKRKKEEGLVRRLEENRDKSAPDFPIKKSLPAEIARLPLCGLTEKEVAERALSGDGDACLMMVQNLCRPKSWSGVSALSWREIQEVEKWLNLAVENKRPASAFMKSFFAGLSDFNRRYMAARGESIPKAEVTSEDQDAYREFKECLEKGDYFVYRTAFFLVPGFCNSGAKQLIYETLLEGAAQGKADSQRDLAQFFFDEGYSREVETFPTFAIIGNVEEKEKKWKKRLEWFPDSLGEGVMKGMYLSGFINADDMEVMKNYRKASGYALRAARQGDLTGMYLWLRYGITSEKKYSEQEWNEIQAYSQRLFEAGYVPYIQDINGKGKDTSFREESVLYDVILRSFYSRGSYEELGKKDGIESRGYLRRFTATGGVEKVRTAMQTYCRMGRSDSFLRDFLRGLILSPEEVFPQSDKEVRNLIREQLEKWAAEGDVYAMYTLAELCEKVFGSVSDPGRAYALLKKALPGAQVYFYGDVPFKDEGKLPPTGGMGQIRLNYAICLKMARLVLDYPEFPGRDEKSAYDQMINIIREWQKSKPGENYTASFYYVLGQYSERGIGCQADRKRALDFYQEGASGHQGCEEGVKRLTAPSSGGTGSGTK